MHIPVWALLLRGLWFVQVTFSLESVKLMWCGSPLVQTGSPGIPEYASLSMRWRRCNPISIQAWGQRLTLNCLRHAALVSRSWYLSSSKSGSPEVGPPAGFVGLSQLQMSKVFGIGVGMNSLESFRWAVLAQRFTFINLMPSTHSWSSRVWTESEK